MIPTLLLAVLAPVALPVSGALPASPVPTSPGPAWSTGAPQDDEETPVEDGRELIKELISTLKGHVKKRGDEDDQAIAVIDQLNQEFDRSGPKDRKAIVKALEDCFKAKRTDELSPGVPDDRLYQAAAVSMRNMAPESVKPLIGLIGHKSHRKNLGLQQQLIMSLGKTRHPDGVKPLMDLLKHKDAELVAAAASSLGYHDEAPLKVRKEAFEALLKILMAHKADMDSDPQDNIARDRYYAIAAPIVTSLGNLSGHDERDPDEWQRWWNKNKKRDWDEEDEE